VEVSQTINRVGAVQKCSDARRTKSRTARRIVTCVERCGLQHNTADERFVKPPAFSGKEDDYL
jgi:hypothetical protein